MYRRYTRSADGQQEKDLPAHGSFGTALLHPLWKKKRAQILARDQNKCVVCHRADGLQVHHRQYHFIQQFNQYKQPWEYDTDLLVTLCETCNQKGHSKYAVPTIIL